MPTTAYEKDADFQAFLQRLIKQRYDGTLTKLKIDSVVAMTQNDQEETVRCKGDVVKLRKVGPIEKVWHDAHFTVIIDQCYWQEHGELPRVQANICNHIHAILVELDDQGEIVLKTRKPDIQNLYTEVLQWFGPWDEVMTEALAYGKYVSAITAGRPILQMEDAEAPAEEAPPAEEAEPAEEAPPAEEAEPAEEAPEEDAPPEPVDEPVPPPPPPRQRPVPRQAPLNRAPQRGVKK